MHESDLYEYLAAPAMREGRREAILQVLEIRLHPEAAQRFKPNLEGIEDLEHLSKLLCGAALADSPEDFQKVLDATGE